MNQFILVETINGQETVINLNNVTCILPYAQEHCTVYLVGGEDDKINIKPSLKDVKELLDKTSKGII